MLLVEEVNVTQFDTKTKNQWLFVDVLCFLSLWLILLGFRLIRYCMAFLVFIPLQQLLWKWTGVDVLRLLCTVRDIVLRYVSIEVAISLLVASTFVTPFIMVFVLRRNFLVRGPRRRFRYLCRYL